MKKKQSLRSKFIEEQNIKSIAAHSWDAMMLASSHDPEHEAALARLENLIYAEVKLCDRRFTDTCGRLSIIERQLERMGAPQYRTIRKGKVKL
jgi:hypothetical protein